VSDRTRDWPASLRLDPSTYIAPGAVVVGEVTLGRDSSVWFNSVLRGDTDRIEVGDESNIQDLSVVHVDHGCPARIGNRVTIGHRAVIHGCVIEDECLIGMGSIVLSGARVGSGSLIGAGALVREGQEIPAGSLAVGMPARVVGQVTEAHREAIRAGTRHYVELARSYLGRGFARALPGRSSDAGTTGREPPIAFLEWAQRLAALDQGPAWADQRFVRTGDPRWRTPPGDGRWSAHEVVCHLRDADREIFLPRIDRLLTEECPRIEYADMSGWGDERHYRDQDSRHALSEWRESRSRLVGRLAPLGPKEWGRIGVHSIRGHVPLGEMVREWTEHDLSHRRQIAEAIGDFVS
jgi:carbonic anhydrase/acetyltransferase-like protein (isoleucine patch superfamily)